MEGKFTVIPIDGNAADVCDPYTDSLRYDGLTWAEAVELCRLSFTQGFQVIVWKIDAAEDGGVHGET